MRILDQIDRRDADYNFFFQIESLLSHRQESVREKANALARNCKQMRKLLQSISPEILQVMPQDWEDSMKQALNFWDGA